jgi:hypothetical protein
MAPFWRENPNDSDPKKKELKGELMIWRTNLRSKAGSNSRIQFGFK